MCITTIRCSKATLELGANFIIRNFSNPAHQPHPPSEHQRERGTLTNVKLFVGLKHPVSLSFYLLLSQTSDFDLTPDMRM